MKIRLLVADHRTMGRRNIVVGAGIAWVVGVVAVGFAYVSVGSVDVSCNALGIGIPLTDEGRIEHDGKLIIDNSRQDREPCGHDLARYGDLGGFDGVLFNDCSISWVDGGRTKAEDLGIPCDQ